MSCTSKITRCATAGVIILMASALYQTDAMAMTPPNAGCNVQSAGVISPPMAEGFRSFWPLYAQIAQSEGVDPILIAPVHYREHFGLDNPRNGQGIFQLFSLVESGEMSFPSTAGAPVADEEFVHQGKIAVQFLKAKVSADFGTNPEDELVKRAYYGYNGRNRLYASQARSGEGPWDGSPYVMNTPGVRELVMMTRDGGGGPTRLDPRPGAWPIYEELRRQCAVSAPPVAIPAEVQAAGLGLGGLVDQPEAGGSSMKEFVVAWSPMQFGHERVLLLMAAMSILAFAYFIRLGAWKMWVGWLFLGTLASSALAALLVADKLGSGWEIGQMWANLSAISSASLDWITYQPRVAVVQAALTGAVILTAVYVAIRFKVSGGTVFAELGSTLSSFGSSVWRLIRRVMGWRLLWIMVVSTICLMVAATRLTTPVWMYGSLIFAMVGFASFGWVNKKSVTVTSIV